MLPDGIEGLPGRELHAAQLHRDLKAVAVQVVEVGHACSTAGGSQRRPPQGPGPGSWQGLWSYPRLPDEQTGNVTAPTQGPGSGQPHCGPSGLAPTSAGSRSIPAAPWGVRSKPTSRREAGSLWGPSVPLGPKLLALPWLEPPVITSIYLDGPENSPGKKVLLPSSPGEPGPAKPMASQGDGRGVGASGADRPSPPCLPSTPSALGGLLQQELQLGSVAALGPDGAAGAPAFRASEPTPNPGTQRPPSRLNSHVHREATLPCRWPFCPWSLAPCPPWVRVPREGSPAGLSQAQPPSGAFADPRNRSCLRLGAHHPRVREPVRLDPGGRGASLTPGKDHTCHRGQQGC